MRKIRASHLRVVKPLDLTNMLFGLRKENAMAKEYTCRFAIKNKAGQHSHVWRIWTRKNDCYLAIRGTAGQHKISFHETGSCQSGLTSEVRESLKNDPNWLGKSRLYDEWTVETCLPDAGYIKLYELIIPHSQLNDFKLKDTNKVEWFLCEEGKAASISIYKFNIKESDKFENISEIARLPLENGYFIVVAFSLIEEKQEYVSIIRKTIIDMYENRNNMMEKRYKEIDFADIRPEVSILVYYKQDGSRYCFEGSLLKNINIINQ